jgi:hypothetical protein
MMHLAGLPRKNMLTACGQPIDGVVHTRTMLVESVGCPKCLLIFCGSRTNDEVGRQPARGASWQGADVRRCRPRASAAGRCCTVEPDSLRRIGKFASCGGWLLSIVATKNFPRQTL